jgi:hypothetical protein
MPVDWSEHLHKAAVGLGMSLGTVVLCAVAATFLRGGALLEFARKIVPGTTRRAAFLAFFLSLVSSVVVVLIAGPARPHVHDEFSHLLAARTFALGRLTNPTPPAWEHFETMHVLMQPTYMSKYPPGQALTQAAGLVVTGRAWVGVILTLAFACSAVAWALAGLIPARWAALGAILCALHPQTVIWSHMYWGGGLGMLGGALVLGGLARLIHSPRLLPAMAMGAGGAILMVVRPAEGLLAGLICAGVILSLLVRSGREQRNRLVWACVWTVVTILLPAAFLIGFYNRAVTGSATLLPYTLHTQSYMSVPLFPWQPMPPPKQYRHEALRAHHDGYERAVFESQTTLPGFLIANLRKFHALVEQHLYRNPALMLAMLALPFTFARSGRTRLLTVCLLPFFGLWLIVAWLEQHYPGPVMPVIFGLCVLGLQRVAAIGAGGFGMRWVTFTCLASVLVYPAVVHREWRHNRSGWWADRARLEVELAAEAGNDLVLVSYAPTHDAGEEWVYNGPDIPAEPVVWARSMGPAADARLMQAYPGRQVWTLEADEIPRRLLPHPAGEAPAASRPAP